MIEQNEEERKSAPVTPTKITKHLARFAHASASPSPVASSSRSLRSSRQDAATPVKSELRSVSPEPPKPQPRVLATPKAKYTKKPRPYASPDVYKHLRPVNDHLGPGLDVVFCGINPGKQSAINGHHYANATNRFWKCLHGAGFTDRLLDPKEDFTLPDTYGLGLTNLVDRPTSEQAELSTLEMRQSVPALLAKLDKHRPRVLCFVGKKIWDAFESVISKSVLPVTNTANGKRKRETEVENRTPIKMLKLESSGVVKVEHTLPVTPVKTPRTPKKAAVQWRWDEPRPYMYCFDPAEPDQVCFFWVVPSTSGLERTLIAEKIEHFQCVRFFADKVKNGVAITDNFQTFGKEGIEETVRAFESAAAKRAANASINYDLE